MARLLIDKEKCGACGICLEFCPFAALIIENKIIKVKETCNLCGACLKVCPNEAIKLETEERKTDFIVPSAARDVWVYIEHKQGKIAPVSLELLGKGAKLAVDLKQHLSAVLLGDEVEQVINEVFKYGVERLYLIQSPIVRDYKIDSFAPCLVYLIRKHNPSIVLYGATTQGRDLASAAATALETGLTADCTDLDIDPETKLLRQTRPAFGGNIMATIVCPERRPQMATVRPKVFLSPELKDAEKKEIIQEEIPISEKDVKTEILSFVKTKNKFNLIDAEIIVAGGQGLQKPENLKLIEELADVLGAAVAASRVIVDLGWISYEHQIGQTGLTVRPRLYIACGISGAIQHRIGMQTSDVIVAINKDPEAPIFKIADYGIVGDVLEVLPLLIEELKKRLK